MRRAYHLPRPKNQALYTVKVLLYTVFLLVTIALTLALATVGRAALQFLSRFFVLPEAFIDLWSDLHRRRIWVRNRPGQLSAAGLSHLGTARPAAPPDHDPVEEKANTTQGARSAFCEARSFASETAPASCPPPV